MKNYLVLILCLLLFGCREEPQIEVIPNYDDIYIPLNKIDSSPQLLEGDEKGLSEKIIKMIRADEKISLDYNLYLDETGNVDKVKVIKSPNTSFTDVAAKEFEKWKFKPGTKDGKEVKSQYRWKFNLDPAFSGSEKINPEEFYVAVEEMPVPIGGLKALQEKIIYPEIAKRAGVEGKVYITAFIDEEGVVVSAQVFKGIGAGLDEAALTAVQETRFTPGKQKGKPVKVQVSIPISFKLQ